MGYQSATTQTTKKIMHFLPFVRLVFSLTLVLTALGAPALLSISQTEGFRMSRMNVHWSERLSGVMADMGLSCAELARRSQLPAEIVRKYVLGDVDKSAGRQT